MVGFTGLSFGAGTCGIFGAAGPDVMHLIEEGIMVHALMMVIAMIRDQPGGAGLVAELDAR